MIIGITGYKRSGKDTLADYLTNLGFIKISFADKLREICSDLFNVSMDYFIDDDKKDTPLASLNNKTPRELLIHVGQGMRDFDPNIWITTALRKCVDTQDYVIPDVRNANEADAIHNLHGMIIRIERNGCVLGNDLPETGLYSTHPNLPTIQNNGSIEDLQIAYHSIVD